MKTRLSTVMMSAYVSAMLASSLAPISGRLFLASPIDPIAAQQAFDTAMSDLDNKTWRVASADVPAAVPQVAIAVTTPKADPVMTDERMARLINLTRTIKAGIVGPKICKVVGLCDGTAAMPMRWIKSGSTDGLHMMGMPPAADSTDILFVTSHDLHLEIYLTDKNRNLRAAAVMDNGVATPLANDKANSMFQKELSLFASGADDLPPSTGTAVAGNS